MSAETNSAIAWRPTPEYIEQANVTRLARRLGLEGIEDLRHLSVTEPIRFWQEVVEDLGIDFDPPFERVVDLSRGPAWSQWFVGGGINVAGAAVLSHARRTPHAPALISECEDGTVCRHTFAELSREVGALAAGLRRAGLGKGDRVAILMPMILEAAVGLYATAAIGAIAVPVFSGVSGPAFAGRLREVGAKAVLTVDGSVRRGNVVPMKAVVDEAMTECPEVRTVVVFRHAGIEIDLVAGRDLDWAEVTAEPAELVPEPTDSEDPFLVMTTSGTSGQPKGAVHVHGGFPVKAAAEVAYQLDIRPDRTAFWVTDMGWIMGPWMLIGANVLGAPMLMYEGSPDRPSATRIWDLAERHSLSMLGVSPTLVRLLAQAGAEPGRELPDLRLLSSAGEPWDSDSYRWLMRATGGRLPIINLSGGTEVAASFLSCHPVEEIKECSLGGPALGMDLDVVDADGKSVRGEPGELICRQPWPGITRGLWNDPERYLDSYWRRYEGVWHHGDRALIDEDGAWFLLGRSDDVLKIAGKRLGPAEVEEVLLSDSAVHEAAVVGMPDSVKGQVIWCFCIAAEGVEVDEELAQKLRRRVGQDLGKPFTPARVVFVASLPRTRSGKVVRRAIRDVALGNPAQGKEAIGNPDALDTIAETLAAGSGLAEGARR